MCYSRKLLCPFSILFDCCSPWMANSHLLSTSFFRSWMANSHLPSTSFFNSSFLLSHYSAFLARLSQDKKPLSPCIETCLSNFLFSVIAHVVLATFYNIHNFIFYQINKMDLILKRLNYFGVEILIKNLKNPLKMLS